MMEVLARLEPHEIGLVGLVLVGLIVLLVPGDWLEKRIRR